MNISFRFCLSALPSFIWFLVWGFCFALFLTFSNRALGAAPKCRGSTGRALGSLRKEFWNPDVSYLGLEKIVDN